ncbi:hypothetical protein ES288_A06G068800v1 [Gossypium darwinii]|uniref:Uncharacterized protein n=1 Tax=Gossypium darwinii TaxID=34276 RepID=A0A5D2G410_GOSDA|nr:hypothetical protein ES288_A06G068800v1 [Gossypium darwinii]
MASTRNGIVRRVEVNTNPRPLWGFPNSQLLVVIPSSNSVMNFKFLLKRPNPCDDLGSILSNFVMNQFVSGKPNSPDYNVVADIRTVHDFEPTHKRRFKVFIVSPRRSIQPQNIPNTPETVTDNMLVCFNTDLASRENSYVPEPFNLQIMIARNIVVKKSAVYNIHFWGNCNVQQSFVEMFVDRSIWNVTFKAKSL